MGADVVLEEYDGSTTAYSGKETVTLHDAEGNEETFVHTSLIEKLPAVTEADNGKVFGVVDGKWQAMEAPSTMPEVSEADNGKVAGVVDGAWQAMAAPKTYAHPPTHPASMITGLMPVAVTGRYDSLVGAPIGKKIILPMADYTVGFDTDSGKYCTLLGIDTAPAVGTVCVCELSGETHTVTVRDAAESEALAGTVYTGFIGNLKIYTGDSADDTGEPFFMAFTSVAQMAFVAVKSASYSTARWFVYERDTVRKLDAQYLPDDIGGGVGSWNELADRPFYDNSVTAVCDLSQGPSVVVDVAAMGVSYGKVTDTILTREQLLKTTLYIDDQGYEMVVPITEENILISDENFTLVMTNYGGFAVSYKTGTIPFSMDGVEGTMEVPEIGTYMMGYTDGEVYGGLVVRFVCDDRRQLDTKHLEPFEVEEPERVYLLEEQELPFVLDDSMGVFSTVVEPAVYALRDGETYIVRWDGLEYTCVCGTLNMNNMNWEAIGNSAVLGGEDTGEPFAIASISTDDNPHYNALVATDNAASHTVAIWQERGERVYRLKARSAPLPPEFDLTAMGLPDVPMDGTIVSAECDTAELLTALKTGVVRVAFTLGGEDVTGILNAVSRNGTCQGGFVINNGVSLSMVHIFVNDTQVRGVCKVLA